MSFEPVPGMRSTVTDGPEGLTILMPTRRMLPVVVFLPIWLIGWAMGETFAIRTMITGAGPGSMFLAVWLTGWTVGGVFAASMWAWMMFGRERLVLGSGRFVHSYELFGLSRPREYDVQAIKNLRATSNVLTYATARSPFRAYGMGNGAITFDYGAKTVSVGAGIDEAEAKMLVQQIRARGAIPNLGDGAS